MNDRTSAFDPNVFLDAQQTEANTKRPPLPEENLDAADGLYLALIGEIKTESGTIGKGDRIGQPWLSMLVPLQIQLGGQTKDLVGGMPQLTITDRVFVDLTPQGTIDNSKGKNRGQRAYRDATGMNKEGDVFAWRMLQGRTVKVKIKHELYEGNIQERVGAILPA